MRVILFKLNKNFHLVNFKFIRELNNKKDISLNTKLSSLESY